MAVNAEKNNKDCNNDTTFIPLTPKTGTENPESQYGAGRNVSSESRNRGDRDNKRWNHRVVPSN